MNHFYKKLVATIATVGLATTMFTTATFADTTGTTVNGTEATISTTDFSDFNSVTLNGAIQNTTATFAPFKVKDPSGTGSGWKVTISATQFTNTENQTLPLGSAVLTAPTVTAGAGSSDAGTVTTTGGAIDLATGSSLKLLSAAVGGGMGTFDISESTLTLNLEPKDVYAGTYTSTATVSLVSGP